MRSVLENFFRTRPFHLSEGDLIAFVDGQMSHDTKRYAEGHLETCDACGRSRLRLDEARRQFDRYVDTRSHSDGRQSSSRRERLLEEVDAAFRAASPGSGFNVLGVSALRLPRFSKQLGKAFASAVVGMAAILLFGILWLRLQGPPLQADGLLRRAVASNQMAVINSAAGVVLQKVRIKASGEITVRAIYRDARGLRHRRPEKLTPNQQRLADCFDRGGVTWDLPLSAVGFQSWHDRQVSPRDRVRPLAGHLLLLSTTVVGGEVESESLTLRETDFHPVARTIGLRAGSHVEEIEIAELEYQVLPWNAGNTDLFDPLPTISNDAVAAARSVAVPISPKLPSDAQLDEAELGARLVLNQLHADTGEQILFDRKPNAIELRGLVETDRRRNELVESLRLVPNLKVGIVSMEDLDRSSSDDATRPAVTEKTTVSALPSPLDLYLTTQRKDAGVSRLLSTKLLNDAVTISQESRSLADLQTSHRSEQALTLIASATLADLVYAHRQKIQNALEEEKALLQQMAGASSIERTERIEETGDSSLTAAADRNLRLCEELTLGGNSHARSVAAIFPDLYASFANVRTEFTRQGADTPSRPLEAGRK